MSRYIYISPSQLGSFEQCSLKWFFRSKAKITTKPNSSLIMGSAVHYGIESNYQTIKETGSPAPKDVVKDITAEAFLFYVRDALLTKKEDASMLKDEAVALVSLHYEKIAPTVQPKDLEVWLNVTLSRPGIPIMIRQRADVITEDDRIIDNKTSARRMDEKLGAQVDGQLSSYALGFREKYGKYPKKVELHRLLRYKQPDHQIVQAERGQSDFDRYVRKVEKIADRMESLDVYPVDDVRVCSSCEYRPICWGHKWWEYLRDPDLTKRNANKLIPEMLVEKLIIEEEKAEE